MPSSISASRVAWALAALVIALVTIDQGGGALLRHAFDRSSFNPAIKPALKNTETLVLGSSTGKRAFDPAHLWPHTYNGAEDGQGLFYVAGIMRNLVPGSTLKRVLVVLDPDEIVQGYRSSNMAHLTNLAPLAIDDLTLRAQLARRDREIDVKYYSGLYPFRGIVFGALRGWLVPTLADDGFQPLRGRTDRLRSTAFEPRPPAPVSAESAAALRDIGAAAARHRLQLILFVTPTAGGYRRDRDPYYGPAMAAARTLLPGACDLTIRDIPELEAIARDGGNFHDAVHFNGDGARRLSAAIKGEVDRHCPPPPGPPPPGPPAPSPR